MHPTASALTHNVAKFIVSFIRVTAWSPEAMKFDLSNWTFSNDISEHDWPATVEKELIETPSVFESSITRLNILSLMHVTINFSEFDPFKTKVFVPLRIFLESRFEIGFK